MDHEANPAKPKRWHTHTYIAHQIREIVPRGGAKIINDFFFNLACQKGPCHLRIIFKARIYVFQGQISISFFMYGLRNQKETSSGVKICSFVYLICKVCFIKIRTTYKLSLWLYYGFFGKFLFHIANFSCQDLILKVLVWEICSMKL